MNSKIRYALVFVVGVLVGLAAGAWGLRALWHHGPPSPERVMKMMDRRLHFTEEQKPQVLAILREGSDRMKAMRSEAATQMETSREEGAKRIRAILNPTQQAAFDEMKKKFDRRFRGKMPPPPRDEVPPQAQGDPK